MKIKAHYSIFASLALLLVGIALFRWLPNKEQTLDSQSTTANRTHSSKAKPNSLRDVARELETATKVERTELISEGVKIARARQTELAEAAKKNPERVLRAMMDLDELAALPPEIRAESEKPFSAVGNIELLWETSLRADGSLSCTHYNQAIIGGEILRVAGVKFGDAHRPMVDILLNGYIVGDLLVLEDSSVRSLSASELAVSSEFFEEAPDQEIDPVTGGNADLSIAALIGGKVYRFENEGIIEYVEHTMAEAETAAIARDSDRTVDHGFEWLPTQATGGGGSNGSIVQASPFQADNIRVLFIRADFSDVATATVSSGELVTSLTETNVKIQEFSYGKASLIPTVTPNAYILPTLGQTVAEAGDSDKIIAEARAAAEADGFVLTDYDVVGVFFPHIGKSVFAGSTINYGGLATVGGANHWINGVSQPNQVEILLHEFGHNYGLFHANYFNPERDFTAADAGTNAVEYLDPNQSSLEYGDIYDRMGEGNKDDGYFSPYATSRLEWMPPSRVIEPTTSGTFTIHRFDHPDAVTGNNTLALRLSMGGDRYNWVGLRQRYATTAGNAYVVGEGIYINRPNLIDATPGSNIEHILDRADSTLSTSDAPFRDATAGVTITNTGSGGSAPNEFITVKVDFDPRLGLESTNIIVDEASGNAAIVVTRSFNSTGACSVDYATTAGTATADTDYYSTSGTVSWADGDDSSKTIYVPIRPDSDSEGSETFTFTLSSPSNAVVPPSVSVATVTIRDAGTEITEFDAPFFNFTVEAIAPLDTGKVLAGGSISVGVIGHIVRFNPDGSEDSTFQKGTGFNNTVKALLLQADGKVIVGGDFTSYNGTPCGGITRLDTNGNIDTDFNTAIGTGANAGVKAIALEQSGSLLIGGSFTDFNGSTVQGLVRISGTGSTLNTLTTSFRVAQTTVNTILLQPDGQIMVGGTLSYAFESGFGFRFGIARLNQSGSRDSTFEPGYGAHFADEPTPADPPLGFVPQDGRFVNANCETIARQANGNYVIGGAFTRYNESVSRRIVGLLPNGSINTNFTPPTIENGQGDGVFTLQGSVDEIAILPTGKILAGGFFTSPPGKVITLEENGTTSTNFSLGGGTTGSNTSIRSFATDPLGNLYIGGNFFDFAGSSSRPIVKISGGLDSFTLWRNGQFSAAQIEAGNTGPEDDFDNDGILNITEMALGLSPTATNSPNSFAIAAENLSLQSSAASESLQATMLRSANNVGVWLVAQFSSDLTTWLPVNPIPGSNATYDVIESTSTRFTVKDKTPAGPGVKRFVRFRALVPN